MTCPHCHATLKAFGHPGIPLHRADPDEYLCDRCTYHDDDSCTYPQRPYATSCTLFRDRDQPQPSPPKPRRRPDWQHRRGILLLLALLLLSVAIALLG